ncbi:MAG: YdeI/OmpD-associated family protein [Archangiaceae bacterium]|nr:YdeI/OmpD-associated family protein [Archangiaceae bacterium]
MAAVRVDPKKVHEFANEERFEAWLRRNWDQETEVWIKIHKARSGLPSITPAQAIDVALAWGWIDAIRKSFDEHSFLQRYCPRGKKSVWSQVNVANVERLTAAKKMQPPGLAQVEAAKADGRWARAYRMTKTEAPPELLAAIRARPKAAAMYEQLSAQNRFALTFRVLALRTEAGRTKRIAAFVEMLERGETLHPNRARRAARPPRASSRSSGS